MLTTVERDALRAFRAGENSGDAAAQLTGQDAWLHFGLHWLLETGRRVRAMRFAPLAHTVVFKEDGSPSLPEEIAIEVHLREQLEHFAPQTRVIGEESGGSLNDLTPCAAIDPVDGTWALVNRSATHATSLAFFQRGRVFLGMTANAADGEIAYALDGRRSRLLQLSCFGEPDAAFELPLDSSPSDKTLVNLQPTRAAGNLSAALHRAWTKGSIGLLKSMGGSPSWALLEAAKGTFVYVNHWSRRAPEPFDLAGSVFLLRQAGGEAIALNGEAIDEIYHQGPFVAGIDRQALSQVADLCLNQ